MNFDVLPFEYFAYQIVVLILRQLSRDVTTLFKKKTISMRRSSTVFGVCRWHVLSWAKWGQVTGHTSEGLSGLARLSPSY